MSGSKTRQEVFRQFLKTFDVGDDNVEGRVSRLDFDTYYKNLSATIENDEFFINLIRSVWHLNPEGYCNESYCNPEFAPKEDTTASLNTKSARQNNYNNIKANESLRTSNTFDKITPFPPPSVSSKSNPLRYTPDKAIRFNEANKHSRNPESFYKNGSKNNQGVYDTWEQPMDSLTQQIRFILNLNIFKMTEKY